MKTYSIPVEYVSTSTIGNGDFLKLKLYMISDGVNRNQSEFLRESFESGIETIRNKPILAYYNPKLKDVEEHNSRLGVDEHLDIFYDYQYESGERPVGVIPESADIYIEHKEGRDWIVVDGAVIWTEYNKQLVDLLKKQLHKKISVEVDFLDWIDDNGIMRVKSWKFLGVTILGKYPDGTMVEEGIEGAHLKLAEYVETEKFKRFVASMNSALNGNKTDILSLYGLAESRKNETFLAKDEWGTGEEIKIDKSKDAVSDSSWGDVSKSELRNKVLKAKNYKTLVKAVYLLVEDGWEESPSSHLKYPVMEIKSGKAVYNSNGLLSAQQYGEKYDKSIAKKAERIRKSLGLIGEEKRDKMSKFVTMAKENGFSFVGNCEGSLLFVKEAEEGCQDIEKMSVYMIDKCKAEEFESDEEKEFTLDCLTEKPMCFEDDEDPDEDPDDDEDDDEGEDDDEEVKKELESCKEELATCKSELENCKNELAARCDELKSLKMKCLKEEAEAIMACEEKCVDDDTKAELTKMLDEGKFACTDDFIRELSYRKFQKELADKKVNKFATFGKKTINSKPERKSNGLDMI